MMTTITSTVIRSIFVQRPYVLVGYARGFLFAVYDRKRDRLHPLLCPVSPRVDRLRPGAAVAVGQRGRRLARQVGELEAAALTDLLRTISRQRCIETTS